MSHAPAVLVTPRLNEALKALEWYDELTEEDVLPRVVTDFLISLRWSVARALLEEVLEPNRDSEASS